MLKGKFASLKELRVKITENRTSFEHASDWIRSCIILYNILHSLGSFDDDEEPQIDNENNNNNDGVREEEDDGDEAEEESKQKRLRLVEWVLQNN